MGPFAPQGNTWDSLPPSTWEEELAFFLPLLTCPFRIQPGVSCILVALRFCFLCGVEALPRSRIGPAD